MWSWCDFCFFIPVVSVKSAPTPVLLFPLLPSLFVIFAAILWLSICYPLLLPCLLIFEKKVWPLRVTPVNVHTPVLVFCTNKLGLLVFTPSRVWLFATPWAVAHQASLSFTIFQSLLKLMSIESVIPSNHLILCYLPFLLTPDSFPTSGSLTVNQVFASDGQSIGVSASALVLPMNIQGWLPLELTGLISLQSKGLLGVFSSTTIQKHKFFGTQPSLWI